MISRNIILSTLASQVLSQTAPTITIESQWPGNGLENEDPADLSGVTYGGAHLSFDSSGLATNGTCTLTGASSISQLNADANVHVGTAVTKAPGTWVFTANEKWQDDNLINLWVKFGSAIADIPAELALLEVNCADGPWDYSITPFPVNDDTHVNGRIVKSPTWVEDAQQLLSDFSASSVVIAFGQPVSNFKLHDPRITVDPADSDVTPASTFTLTEIPSGGKLNAIDFEFDYVDGNIDNAANEATVSEV